jgi:hypothetical protein
MRTLRFRAFALIATLALAPVASASALAPVANTSYQDLRSPDARDAARATLAHARGNVASHQDLRAPGPSGVEGRSAGPRVSPQGEYYASYGTPTPIPREHAAHGGSSPWLGLAGALALTFVAAGAVAFAVRSRRSVARVRVS